MMSSKKRVTDYAHRVGRMLVESSLSELGCWLWKGATSKGYGRVRINGVLYQAHCVVYEFFVEPIPEGMDLDHLCRVRNCINFNHLEPVPRAVNLARGDSFIAENMRKTHCFRGHPLVPPNLSKVWTGQRHCLACGRIRSRITHERRKREREKNARIKA